MSSLLPVPGTAQGAEWAFEIPIRTTTLSTNSDDGVGSNVVNTVNPGAGLPYSYTSTSIDGLAASEAGYSLTNSGFDITLDHARTGAYLSIAQSSGYIYFSADQDIDYIASGSYTAVDPSGRRTLLYSRLHDDTAGSYVYRAEQQSYTTVNESFTLGGSGGDSYNFNSGSLTGTLIAGHNYQFHYNTFVLADTTASPSGVTGTGNVSLTFVPEPTTALLLTLGLALLGIRRRH